MVLAPADVIAVGGLFSGGSSATWARTSVLVTDTFPLVLLLVFLSLVSLGYRRPWFVVTFLCKRLRWWLGQYAQPGGSGQEVALWSGLTHSQLKEKPYDAAYCLRTATRSHCLIVGHCWSLWLSFLQIGHKLEGLSSATFSTNVAEIEAFLGESL